jgi:hypothetical protein
LVPQTGSIEERLEQVAQLPANLPKLRAVLLLDLMAATFPEGSDLWKALERQLVAALGLPPEHQAGDWHYTPRPGKHGPRDIYDYRGRAAAATEEMLAATYLIDMLYQEKYGERMSIYALHQELTKRYGFRTRRETLSAWRRNGSL